jgi:hypothetical protein
MENSASVLSSPNELDDVDVNEENVTQSTAPATAAQTGVILEEGTGVDDEIDDEAIIEGSVAQSVQIAPTDDTNPIGADVDDPMLFIQLGDRIIVDSTKYGRTIGTVYYRNGERISIKPDGVSNMLHDFNVEETENGEIFNEDDGVISVMVIEKRKFESFVEQQDLRINQIIDTFDESGALYKSYKITQVDKENDVIQITDLDDPDTPYDLHFNFIGIESDEDFKVISIRQLTGDDKGAEGEKESKEGDEFKEVYEDDEEGAEEEDGDEIEEVGFVEIVRPKVFREAAVYEQRIPDTLQKVDALNDFIGSIDPSLQKDPKSIRAVRILVETLFNLKQATIAYNDDGSVRGQKEISATTLAELINKTTVPLGRPVLKVSKKEYEMPDEETAIDIGRSEEAKASEYVHFVNFEDELSVMVQDKSAIVSSKMTGAPGGQIVREWNDQQRYLKEFLSPWKANGVVEPQWHALSDSEFFRTMPPDSTIDSDGEESFVRELPGYVPSVIRDKDSDPIFDKVHFGIERALTTTYRKGDDNRKKQALLPEESATMNSYLIFPAKTASTIGTTRSSSIAVDSGRSQMTPKTMLDIIKLTGAPKEVGTSADLILLDVEGTTLGNIPLNDYIDGISVPALGLGDTFATLEQYGVDKLELTPELAGVLLNKIDLYQKQLISTLAKLRTIIETEGAKEPEANPFLENPAILEEILTQPKLVEDLLEFERINPTLASSDLGKVAYLLKKHQDYFQVAPGKNPVLIAKALLDANNDAYIQSLKIANIIKYNQLNAGFKPKKNTCNHVKDLVAVRRIGDDYERFKNLVDFFKKYQGERDNNWINCNLCKEHLLCIHERLQIQAFLSPKEKQAIDKEIILKFSGGVFQGKYICRNCGQAIKDLDFDNNLEFDDEGRPKSGTAVLVDKDAVLEEKLEELMGVPIEPVKKVDLKLSDKETIVYNVIREISQRVGINLDNAGYRRIIDHTLAFMGTFPTRSSYESSKKSGSPDYDVASSRNLITASGTFLLLEIQTKIPSYVVRYTLMGCKTPGFDGYPLDSDPSRIQGIEYIACAIGSIRRNEAPWNQTGFQKITDEVKRQTGIVAYIKNVLKQALKNEMTLAHLSEKRAYLTDVIGVEADKDRPKDMIPATFLPEQIIITPEDAAKDAITPEVAAAMGNKGSQALVKLWIRQAHSLAKQTASLIRGSPLSETTCCLSNIEGPGTFWKSASDLPPIGKRQLVPNQQGQPLVTEFIPRDAGSVVAEPDKELYYRLFLKCCFQGPRKGYPHEPGLTNMCPWCEFQFPTNPAVMDTDTEGKTALASQTVDTNTSEFDSLLDTIHKVNNVPALTHHEIKSVREIMAEFGELTPQPIHEWREVIAETTTRFLELPPNSDRGDIAAAAGVISEATAGPRRVIYERLTSTKLQDVLEEIVTLSWSNFFQVIQNYFITPLKRMVVNYNTESLFIPTELEKSLSKQHVDKDLKPILEAELSTVSKREDILKRPALNLARAKINYFIKQMSAILAFKTKVRPIIIPGRDVTLTYIQRTLLYGPLASLLNSSELPPGFEDVSSVRAIADPSMKFLLEVIAETLVKYKSERISFNDEELKQMIAIRNEKERTNIIDEFDKMTDEERAVELMNKRLGIGKWAVGGTKLIYAYDKDYYDLEREKRLAAGIFDVPGLGQDTAMLHAEADALGFQIMSDADYEGDGGYDFTQTGEDDA